jgi:2-polyprenyl-3-methyl-5-hydroxy-6-metoxy-1,4-benzoquinol methylase
MASNVVAQAAREEIWQRERDFFDAQANIKKLKPIQRSVLHRYTGELRDRYHAEFRYSLLGDVAGKSVLVVGCGEGGACVLLAKLGARVTGIDISEGAIELAKQRAALNGVSIEFMAAPIETVEFQSQFDFVLVEALLHHVLHDLDNVVSGLLRACAKGGRIVMSEPLNLCPTLREIRLKLGTPDATPDERPLEHRDLAVVRRHAPEMRAKYFRALGRIDTMVLRNRSYETTGKLSKFFYDALVWVDELLLRLPCGYKLSSVGVMWIDV